MDFIHQSYMHLKKEDFMKMVMVLMELIVKINFFIVMVFHLVVMIMIYYTKMDLNIMVFILIQNIM